jgi:hypothetical protein
MAKAKNSEVPQARIVHDSRDSSKDKFIPLADAKKLYNEGRLARIEGCGRNAFTPIGKR